MRVIVVSLQTNKIIEMKGLLKNNEIVTRNGLKKL